jgi:asparagine synthetase B (glutamine-hydrolysing)
MKPDVGGVLRRWATSLADDDVAVLLSGGIDSSSLMFALLDAGKRVTAYSFTLGDRESTDFVLARRNSGLFGCDFVPIVLPTDLEMLQADMRLLCANGARSKTDYECAWPMLYAYAICSERIVASGMGADGHFCISKKGMIHWRDRIDEFRRGLYSSPRYAQKPIHDRLAAKYGKVAEMPYLTDAMRAEFLGTTWDEVNKPKQKQPIISAFKEQFARIKVGPHTNLQLGDSGISQHFAKLLDSSWNRRGHRSVVGIYNALNAGAL